MKEKVYTRKDLYTGLRFKNSINNTYEITIEKNGTIYIEGVEGTYHKKSVYIDLLLLKRINLGNFKLINYRSPSRLYKIY